MAGKANRPWSYFKAELDRRGKQPQWLANRLGSSIQRVHNWKARGIPPEAFDAVASAFGESLEWVAGRAAPKWKPGAEARDPDMRAREPELPYGAPTALTPSEWTLVQDVRESLAEDQAFIREEAAARAKKFRELRQQIMSREGVGGGARSPTVPMVAPPVASEQRQKARADLDTLGRRADAKRAAAEEVAAKNGMKKNRTR